MIRDVEEKDAIGIASIYNYYVDKTWITFEQEAVSSFVMAERIRSTTENYPWMVFEEDGKILGYIYADRWKSRAAYRYTVESTIYLDKDAGRKGIGRKLYTELLPRLKEMGIKTVVVCIAIPNEASIGLHEKLGFRKVGIFTKVGYKFETWIDVGFWELVF
ncbi:MAG: N-acetyltransferase [Spirochaetales bacterium]|nr:N-acetyltransferase [Spirochaetales bacterium]